MVWTDDRRPSDDIERVIFDDLEGTTIIVPTPMTPPKQILRSRSLLELSRLKFFLFAIPAALMNPRVPTTNTATHLGRRPIRDFVEDFDNVLGKWPVRTPGASPGQGCGRPRHRRLLRYCCWRRMIITQGTVSERPSAREWYVQVGQQGSGHIGVCISGGL